MRIPDKCTAIRKPAPVAAAYPIAIGLAILVVSAGALGWPASVHGPRRTAGSAWDGDISAEQRRQAIAMAKIEASLKAVQGEVAALKAQEAAPRRDAGRTNADPARTGSDAPPTHPEAGTDEIGLAALRGSLDDMAEHTRHALIAINKRIDWLETLVYSSDATGSVQVSPPPNPLRHGVRPTPAWVLLYAESGLAVISGKDGTLDVTPGFVIPGLGEVEAIRQEGSRWVVEAEKGTIRER